MNFSLLVSFLALSSSLLYAEVTVENPWARASQGPNSAMFGSFTNASDQDDQLISAEVKDPNFCDHTELHAHIEENGIMKMRPVDNIVIPANGTTELKPGGLHIMFMKISNPMNEDAIIPVTLKFQSGQTLDLQVPVKPAVAHKH